MATLNQLRAVLHSQPFRPFALRMGDGTLHTVKHPDFISIPPGGRAREAHLYTEGPTPEEPVEHRIDLAGVLEIITPAPHETATTQAP